MSRQAFLFAFATLSPVAALAMGAVFGGLWAVASLFYMTGFVALIDALSGRLIDTTNPDIEFPAAAWLSYALIAAHFTVMALFLYSFSGVAGHSVIASVCMFMATGLYLGQVSNSNAHEMIHKPSRLAFYAGRAAYASIFFGHHGSAHRLVHHRFVATPDDPSTARLGESFYRFFIRASRDNFLKGFEAEKKRVESRDKAFKIHRHPYAFDVVVSAATVVAVTWFTGPLALIAFVALSAYAQMQLILSDYVQHYGLRRQKQANGRYEPVAAAHSWNAPHWYSSAMMLNAPRHSDHHVNPAKPFEVLELPTKHEAPMLPRSLPTMCTIALIPTAWRSIMDSRAAKWQFEDPDLAIPAE